MTELSERGIDPLALRYLMFTSRYGRKLDYSDASIEAAAAGLASLRARLQALGPAPADGPWQAPPAVIAEPAGDRPEGIRERPGDPGPDRAHTVAAPLTEAGRALHERFVAALDDDLDLPTALATIRETLRADLPADERRWLVLDADAVLGLDLHGVWSTAPEDATPDDVQALVATRTAARERRDFPAADAARDELAAMGWEVIDGPGGPVVRRRGDPVGGPLGQIPPRNIRT